MGVKLTHGCDLCEEACGQKSGLFDAHGNITSMCHSCFAGPSAPINVTLSLNSSTAIYVLWKKPQTWYKQIDEYYVQYQGDDGVVQKKTVLVSEANAKQHHYEVSSRNPVRVPAFVLFCSERRHQFRTGNENILSGEKAPVWKWKVKEFGLRSSVPRRRVRNGWGKWVGTLSCGLLLCEIE